MGRCVGEPRASGRAARARWAGYCGVSPAGVGASRVAMRASRVVMRTRDRREEADEGDEETRIAEGDLDDPTDQDGALDDAHRRAEALVAVLDGLQLRVEDDVEGRRQEGKGAALDDWEPASATARARTRCSQRAPTGQHADRERGVVR